MKRLYVYLLALLVIASQWGCGTKTTSDSASATEQKIGVLLVNHGSHSPTWRQALLDLDSSVRETILADERVQEIKTAFMEYTEPSIATRMKEFDEAGFTDVIIVPVFLTVSSHSFDDIPTILGLKTDPGSLETLKIEKIETYKTKATCHITPLLDFTDILQKNIARRVKELSTSPADEGLALIAYGDAGYNTEWTALMDTVGRYVNSVAGISSYSYGWCGHIASYDPVHTTNAINDVLKNRKKAIVMPVLVAHDEMFQVKIIGDGIKAIENHKECVIYRPDAILPDPNIRQWVIDVVGAHVDKISPNVASVE
ncbi:MAG: CbiX/SirB N-terminal domain-containing protein [Flavobacteriales bacterium]|nr:CbiX/SirB N-terminal domain-containing protein [Bacteroidota bacterium]MCB9240140.1 CbiX/SirB N-terminal domain-containing protein [Flavobacteriales bacterium]